MDTKRLILFVIFSMSILMLWDAWQRQSAPVATQQASHVAASSNPTSAATSQAVDATVGTQEVVNGTFKLLTGQRINVTTDLYKADIETVGGDLRRLELLKHRAADNDKTNFVLLDDAAKPMTYVAQTGLIGAELPTHHAVFSSTATSYQMQENQDKLEVRLSWVSANGIAVYKVYTLSLIHI